MLNKMEKLKYTYTKITTSGRLYKQRRDKDGPNCGKKNVFIAEY